MSLFGSLKRFCTLILFFYVIRMHKKFTITAMNDFGERGYCFCVMHKKFLAAYEFFVYVHYTATLTHYTHSCTFALRITPIELHHE